MGKTPTSGTSTVLRRIVLAGIALITVACTSASPSAPARSSAMAPTESVPAPTVSIAPPSSTPTPLPSPLALCADKFTPCSLTAGTYSNAPFTPTFHFTVGEGWHNDRAWPHGGEIAASTGWYFEWGTGFSSGVGPAGKNVSVGTTSDDLLKHFRSFKGFTITAPVPVTVGGQTGRQVDMAMGTTNAPQLLTIPEDGYNLAPGEKVRLMLFDIHNRAVLLMIEVPIAEDFDAAVTSAKPLLDSIVWE